jgi:maltose/maltodextrin transport system substrate-binding protein
MHTTRRQLVVSSLSASALALGGLASGAAHAADAGKLLVWFSVDGSKGVQKLAEEFTKKTGVAVTVEAPEDGPGKFQQAAAAGKGPDIWIWAHDRIGEWISGGLLQPVTPNKKLLADIDPLAMKAFTVAGKTWGYPYTIEAISLVYNKALVQTPPKTFEDVMALDKKLSAGGKKAILWEYTNTYFTWPLLAANGGYAFKQKPDGTYDGADTGVNNPGALKGVELLDKLLRRQWLRRDGRRHGTRQSGDDDQRPLVVGQPAQGQDRFRRGQDPHDRRQEGRAVCRCQGHHDQQGLTQ